MYTCREPWTDKHRDTNIKIVIGNDSTDNIPLPTYTSFSLPPPLTHHIHLRFKLHSILLFTSFLPSDTLHTHFSACIHSHPPLLCIHYLYSQPSLLILHSTTSSFSHSSPTTVPPSFLSPYTVNSSSLAPHRPPSTHFLNHLRPLS